MSYDEEAIEKIHQWHREATTGLSRLRVDLVEATGSVAASPRRHAIYEHMIYGAARRTGVLRSALQRTFDVFPPETAKRLDPEDLHDVEMFLHAFLINLSGIFDNWAWAYVLRHDLLEAVGGRKNVGCFLSRTTDRLPKELQAYVRSDRLKAWHADYAKEHRDALAHRIPPYVAPASMTEAEGEQLMRAAIGGDGREHLQILESLQAPCFLFTHSFIETNQRVWLHPQIVQDALLVVEAGDVFLRHWQEPPSTPGENAT